MSNEPTDQEMVEFIYGSIIDQLQNVHFAQATVAAWAAQYDDPNSVLARLSFVLLGLNAKDLARSQGNAGAIQFAAKLLNEADMFGGER